jgi:hypothetical protein
MFRSHRSDEQRAQIVVFEGAVGSSGPDTEPAVSLRMNNYDRDIGRVVHLAEIEARDAFGDAESNGYGNIRIATASDNVLQDVMVLTHEQRVGVGTATPTCALDVAGDVCVSGKLMVAGHYVGLDPSASNRSNSVKPMLSEVVDVRPGSTWSEVGQIVCVGGDTNPVSVVVNLVTAKDPIVVRVVECDSQSQTVLTTKTLADGGGSVVRVELDILPSERAPGELFWLYVLGRGRGRVQLVGVCYGI